MVVTGGPSLRPPAHTVQLVLLCAAVLCLVAWFASERFYASIWSPTFYDVTVGIDYGAGVFRVSVWHEPNPEMAKLGPVVWRGHISSLHSIGKKMFLWFDLKSVSGVGRAYSWVHIPIWVGTIVFGLLSSVHWLAQNRKLNKRKNCCASCGYCLHGLLDVSLCPECGRLCR